MADLDRTFPPLAKPIEAYKLPKVDIFKLDNGSAVYVLPYGSQEIVELSIIVPGGKSFEPGFSVSGFTSKMLQEGTQKKSGFEFANALENIGAFINVETGIESASVDLTCLTRHLPAALDLVSEMILFPSFDENEFRKLKERSLHFLEMEEQKTDFLVRREFLDRLYGPDHPYGKSVRKEHFLSLELKDVVGFHQSNYSPSNMTFIVSGRFEKDELVKALNQRFGEKSSAEKIDWKNSHALIEPPPPVSGAFHFPKADARQASIRVGHRGFNRHHPDYHAMSVTTMLFGGYFGSRLMKNIREDKGYTYGIYATWLAMKFGGYFIVQADVGVEYTQKTLEEIRKEMTKLLENGTTSEELEMVKNYKLGKMISGRETPSQIVDILSTCFVNNIPFEDLDKKFGIINSVTPEQVVELARKYYKPEDFLEVSVGGE